MELETLDDLYPNGRRPRERLPFKKENGGCVSTAAVALVEGKDLTKLPLLKPRAQLEHHFAALPGVLELSPVFEGDVNVILQRVKEFHLKG